MSIPDPPTNVQLIAGNESIQVSWTPPANVGPPETFTGYLVTITDSVDSANDGNYSTTETYYNFTGLVNGRMYDVIINTTNSGPDGPSDPTAPLSATPAAPPSATVPGVPTNMVLTRGNQSISVSWGPPDNDGGSPITGYNVYLPDTLGINPPVMIPILGEASSYTISGLTNGVTYQVYVTAVNEEGEGQGSTPQMMYPAAPPTLSLTAESAELHSITVNWSYSDPESAEGALADVVIQLQAPGDFSIGYTNSSGQSTGSYTFTELEEGTYTVTARALDASGGEIASAPVDPSNAITASVASGLAVSSVPNYDNTFSPSWTLNEGMGNLADFWYNVDVGGEIFPLVSGQQFPRPFSAGNVSFTVRAYTDEQRTNLLTFKTSTASVVNGTLGISGSLNASTANYESGFRCVIVENTDTSFEQYLSQVARYSVSFTDSNAASINLGSQTLSDLSFDTDYSVVFPKAGIVQAAFSAYIPGNTDVVGGSSGVERNVTGLNVDVDTSVPRAITVNWVFHDTDNFHGGSFNDVLVTLTIGNNVYTQPDSGSAANGSISGSVTFGPPAPVLAMVAGPSLSAEDYGNQFLITVAARNAAGDPLVSYPGILPGIVPDYVAQVTASARGGINCAIVSWEYSDPNASRPPVASYTVEFNNTQSSGSSRSIPLIPPTDTSGVFGDDTLEPGTYDVAVKAVLDDATEVVSSPPQSITVFAAPAGFGVVSSETSAGNNVNITWSQTLDLALLVDSYNISENTTITLTPENGAPISGSVSNSLYSKSFSAVAGGSYEVRVSQNLVGSPFGGQTFSNKLIQTNMPQRLVLGNAPNPAPAGGAALNFQRPYSADVSQGVEITLIGTEIPDETTEDQTIVVKVSAQSLKDAFVVTPATDWELSDLTSTQDGNQSYPAVTFKPSMLLTSAGVLGSTVIADFEALNSREKRDDADVEYDTLQEYISGMSNDLFGGASSVLLNSIPVEAVRTVDNVDLTIASGQSIAALLADDQVDAERLTQSGDLPSDLYALRLFAQAVGAGKVSAAGAGQNVQFDFIAGDSISLFVNYSMTKTRKYLLDGNVAAQRFTIGGVTLDTTPVTGNNVETSQVLAKRVEFKFTAVAPPSAP